MMLVFQKAPKQKVFVKYAEAWIFIISFITKNKVRSAQTRELGGEEPN